MGFFARLPQCEGLHTSPGIHVVSNQAPHCCDCPGLSLARLDILSASFLPSLRGFRVKRHSNRNQGAEQNRGQTLLLLNFCFVMFYPLTGSISRSRPIFFVPSKYAPGSQQALRPRRAPLPNAAPTLLWPPIPCYHREHGFSSRRRAVDVASPICRDGQLQVGLRSDVSGRTGAQAP